MAAQRASCGTNRTETLNETKGLNKAQGSTYFCIINVSVIISHL